MDVAGDTDDFDAVRREFDADHYLAVYPDIAAAQMDPFEHFSAAGWMEGRNPNSWFSTSEYLQDNPDVRRSGGNPFEHYVRVGRAQGRITTATVRAEFDADHYLTANPDVASAGLDPFEHFMASGWREGRSPNAWFSIAGYLEENPDIGALKINPFKHYIQIGRGAGRKIKRDLGFRHRILMRDTDLERRIDMVRVWRAGREATTIHVLERALSRLGPPSAFHLSVSQDDFTRAWGGIQLCLKLESAALRAAGIVHVHLFAAAPGLVVDVESERPLLALVLDGEFLGGFEPAPLARVLGLWSAGRTPSFAVHCLLGHSLGAVIAVLQSAGARAGYFWLHDFSSACAQPHLLRNGVAFCGGPPIDSAACRLCDYGQRRLIQIAEHARLFAAFDLTVVAPSQFALDLWRKVSCFASRPARLHPHVRLDAQPGRKAPRDPGSIRVGFLGAPSEHKGWPVFAELAQRRSGDARYEFHHLGAAPYESVKAHITEVTPTPRDPAPMRAAIERLGIDVAILWSLCPETFGFTAYEAIAAGAMIVTNPDSGNVAVLAGSRGAGVVLDDEDSLFQLFETGRILSLLEAAGDRELFALSYSRMTVDLIAEAAR